MRTRFPLQRSTWAKGARQWRLLYARARPGPQARTPKAGSVTKAVQQGRFTRFSQEVIAELKKVSWPNRAQLTQATLVVIVAVAIIAAFLGLADQASDWIVHRVF